MEKRIDVFEELKRTKEELEHERRLRKDWQGKYYELKSKFEEIDAKLNQILNSNTPSSQVPFTEKDMVKSPNRNAKGTNPRGKPKRSNGGTRKMPTKFDKKEYAKADKCSKCKSRRLKHIHTEKIHVWELPTIKFIVILFHRYIYKCKDCGEVVYGAHKDLPKEGLFGPRLTSFLIEIRQNFAGSYGKLSDFLLSITGDTFSGQAIKDRIKGVSSRLEPSYNNIKEKLKDETAVNSDETKWPVNGSHFYLWLFVSIHYVFITINKSRARKVIIDVLGDFFDGVVISDCLSVYRKFAAAFQKCWSHLLRKTYWLKEKHPKADIKIMHRKLSNLYEEAEKYRKSKLTDSERIWCIITLTQKLQRISNYKWKSKYSKGIVKNWLKEFEGQWLVGVMMPEVELTNNKDERGIRKVIPTRKMLGGHRTEEGAKDFAIIETHRQTWKLRGHSPYNKMVDFLVKENMKTEIV